MTSEKRLGSIDINGTAYPLNYCMRNADEINETIGAPQKDKYGAYGIVAQNIHVLALLLRDGAAYKHQFYGENITPPTEEELLTLLTPADNTRIVAAIRETIELGGMRLIEVAAKKAKTAPQKRTD